MAQPLLLEMHACVSSDTNAYALSRRRPEGPTAPPA
jgi:hypothetical protein